jgi:hypothetical protein
MYCDGVEDNEVEGACSMHGGEEKYMKDFDWKTLWKRTFVRPRSRWEGNIKNGT